jgi:thiamine pyrophosphate-dependent acetolactate synthase large subunit-like protein
MQVFQLSADARDLGRTYSTKLALAGHIRPSLRALLPLLTPKLAERAKAYAALRKAAEREREVRRAQLKVAADAEFSNPVITPLVAGREMARAIGPQTAIVDEAPATLGALRAFLRTECTRQYSFSRGGALGWGMPAAVGFSLGIDRGCLDRRRWRHSILPAGAVDSGSRKTSRKLCRDQQPGIQHPEEVHEIATTLCVGARQSLHRHGHR